jgi:hypothetical protein
MLCQSSTVFSDSNIIWNTLLPIVHVLLVHNIGMSILMTIIVNAW